jgi:hypothetical protein
VTNDDVEGNLSAVLARIESALEAPALGPEQAKSNTERGITASATVTYAVRLSDARAQA